MAFTFFVAVILYTAILVRSETHTISFDNQCGYGTPKLIKGNDVLSSTSYTTNGSLASAIAYLDTGSCLFNGEGCTVVEVTLTNPTTAGSGSSVDISLIPPLAFSVNTSFQYTTGVCSGQGASCATPDCSTAFFHPDDTWVQVACQEYDADLRISFCGGDSAFLPSSSSSSSSTEPESSETTETVPSTTESSVEAPPSSVNEVHSTVVAATSLPSTSGYKPRPSCSQKRRSSMSVTILDTVDALGDAATQAMVGLDV
ncbi:hypothetical protein BDZ89DRAFT_1017249 [Hymenopellis radicata]|nr:hypothetical protein BDZ89DRAFT_1017249 [Hymenopellis radicata]